MDNDALQKQIGTRLRELPEDVRQAVLSSELDQRIQTLGKKHQLHIDQAGALQDETMLVMLGFVDPASFVSRLQKELNIPKEKAEGLATDISNEVFMPIRESMKQFMASKESAAKAEHAAPTISVPPVPVVPVSPQNVPQKKEEVHPADLMLTQKTVSVPSSPIPQKPTEPPRPAGYKTDPYREPAE